MYSMSLVERLGYKTLDNLYSSLDNNEISEWMAYDLASNHEWRENYLKEFDLEVQKNQTLEEEADRMRAMLMGLGK